MIFFFWFAEKNMYAYDFSHVYYIIIPWGTIAFRPVVDSFGIMAENKRNYDVPQEVPDRLL